jgi:hypothetical protein
MLPGALACLLGLALCASATAQDANKNNGKDRGAVTTQTVRGLVAGVTAEGEVALDYRTQRAVAAEMMFVTIVGSPHRADGQASAEGEKERGAAGAQRHRHNVYVLWLSPRTQVRDANQGASNNKQGTPANVDALEIGDHVEVTFTPREDSNTGAAKPAKHGRHRTYYGDATSITILGAQAQHDGQAGSQGERRSDGEKDKSR